MWKFQHNLHLTLFKNKNNKTINKYIFIKHISFKILLINTIIISNIYFVFYLNSLLQKTRPVLKSFKISVLEPVFNPVLKPVIVRTSCFYNRFLCSFTVLNTINTKTINIPGHFLTLNIGGPYVHF